MFKSSWKLTCLSLTLLAHAAFAQDSAPKDVPPTHWAYTAVQDLAGKGLIKGYPPDNRFLGKRTLTRYEMATIIERMLARVDELVGPKANKSDVDQALGQKADKADLDALKSSIGEIRDLVDEFKKELMVIGADLKTAQSEIDSLKGQIGKVSARADEAHSLAEQALENITEVKGTLKTLQDQMAKKATVDRASSLHIGGAFQMWAETAFGGTPNGYSPTTFSSSPPGRQFSSGGGAGDTFRIKRAEIYFTGQMLPGSPNANPTSPDITDKPGQAYYYLLLDTGKVVSNQNSTLQPNSTLLQDAFVGYQLAKRFRFEIGQQKTGLDEEGDRSSAELYTIERSIMNLLPVIQNPAAPATSGANSTAAIGDVGRIGYVRDIGAIVRYNSSFGKAMIGIWNGNGTGQATSDTERQHFADFNAYYTGKHLLAGIWGGENIGDSQPAFKNDRYGATLLYHNGQHFFEAEGAFTRDFSPLLSTVAGVTNLSSSYQGSYGRGGYALYGYTLTNKFQPIARFDVWDPAYQSDQTASSVTTVGGYKIPRMYHDLREYTIGFNYYPYGKNKTKSNFLKDTDFSFDQRFKIQLNYIVDAVETNGVGFWGKSRNLLIADFQAAF